jgi:hypothetical protein
MTKEEKRAYDRARYLANKEQKKAYRDANRERTKEYNATYREVNQEYFKNYNDTVRNPYRSVIDCPDGMVVHHINHDHSDNRRTNLLAMTPSDHASYHRSITSGNYEKASEIIYNYEVF